MLSVQALISRVKLLTGYLPSPTRLSWLLLARAAAHESLGWREWGRERLKEKKENGFNVFLRAKRNTVSVPALRFPYPLLHASDRAINKVHTTEIIARK